MNFRTQVASRLRLTKILLVLCLLMLTSAFRCTFNDDYLYPAFPGGIRIQTQEKLQGLLVGGVPVPNVPNSGSLTAILGPGTGSQDSFAGPTNALGIRDWPLARTNATWSFSVTYTTVIPVCGGALYPGIFVPSTGMWWVWTCYL